MVEDEEDKSSQVSQSTCTQAQYHLSFALLVARTCNLIFIVLDVLKPLGDKKVIESELEGFGIRLNKKPPQILVRKKVGQFHALNCADRLMHSCV